MAFAESLVASNFKLLRVSVPVVDRYFDWVRYTLLVGMCLALERY
jgi:hypothetical protein